MKRKAKLHTEYRKLSNYSVLTSVRKAAQRFNISHGKVYRARQVFPPPPAAVPPKAKASSTGPGSIPAIWCKAFKLGHRLVAHQQQDALLRVLLGYELLRAKAAVPFGDWLGQLKQYCPWHSRSAEKFQRVAETLVPSKHLKFEGPSYLRPLPRKVVRQIKATIAGRSFERLYNDLFKKATALKPKNNAEAAVPKAIAKEANLTGEIPHAAQMATEAVRVEAMPQQTPAQAIAQLERRIRELSKKRPEMAPEVAKIGLGLQQAQIVVIAAQELLARAGEMDT